VDGTRSRTNPTQRVRQILGAARSRRVGERAVASGLITDEQWRQAQAEHEAQRAPEPRGLDDILVAHGWIGADDVARLERALASEAFIRAGAKKHAPLPPEAAAAASDPARQLAEFVLVERIGAGGAGEVLKAWDRNLGRWVAIKRPNTTFASPAARERFEREALAVARLFHESIVPVFRVGEHEGRPYLVMPYIEGTTLAHQPRTSVRAAVEVIRTAALAVHHAHEQGVVHRDLKPGNIIIDSQGRVFVLDFGLVYLVADKSQGLTQPGDVMGTPAYMSPEQARGDAAGRKPATDVYGLGATLYFLDTGRAPFDGESFAEIISKVLRDDPVPPRKLRPDLPRDAETVIAKAMDKDPRRRYATAEAFAEDLRRLATMEAIAARSMSLPGRVVRRLRRHALLSVVSAAALVLTLGAALGGRLLQSERASAVQAIRESARQSLETALRLRRAGDYAGMLQTLPQLRSAHARSVARLPRAAEPDYLMGRMHRALMQDAEALAFQEKALAKDPAYAPALYERAILLSRDYGRERERLVERQRSIAASPLLADTAAPQRFAPEALERALPALGRLREAVLRDCTALERALEAGRDTPSVSEAMVQAARGIFALHRGDHTGARTLLERAVLLGPQLEEAWEALALSLSAQELWDEALRVYGEGIARDRGYLPHLLGRSRVAMIRASTRYTDLPAARADYAAAAADLTAALALDGTIAEAWLRRGFARTHLAQLAQQSGNDPSAAFASAETDLAQAGRLGGVSVELHHALGVLATDRAAYRTGAGVDPLPDFAAAEAAFGAALALVPGDPWPHLWRGYTYMQRGLHRALLGQDALADFVAAQDDLSRATRMSGPRTRVWEWLGFAASERGAALAAAGRDASDAWTAAEQALAEAVRTTDPPTWPLVREAALWTYRGLFAGGRPQAVEPYFARADADLARALALAPDFAHAWVRRGILRAERGRLLAQHGRPARALFTDAEADFGRVLALEPRHAQALIERGRVRLLRGDREAARRDLDQAVAINPHYAHRRAELLNAPAAHR
jgi:serine/threonine-protein kinase